MPQSSNSSDTSGAHLVEFHRPAYRDWRWLETCWFSCFVPERGMRLHLRAAFRSNLDVAHTMVALYSRSGGVLDMDFYDAQSHQPIGTNRYSDFTLPSGLSVKGRPVPDKYRVRFDSRCHRLSVDLDCRALMPPVGLGFTALPVEEKGFAAFTRAPRGDAPTGHIDQTFHITGTITLDGEAIAVDSISNHDHSWSPRAESRSGCGTFDEFHFGEDLTVLTQAVQKSPGSATVTHGYALVGGELRKLVSATAEFTQTGYRTESLKYTVIDETGETFLLTANVDSSIVQDQGSNGLTVMNLCRAQWGDKTGVAESMWHWDIPEVQRRIRRVRAQEEHADLAAHDALALDWT